MKKASIIVTSHLSENQEYLTMCLDSILKSEDLSDFEIIQACGTETRPIDRSGVKTIWDRQLDTSRKKVSKAILEAEPSYALVFISDDVIVHKQCLTKIVDVALKHNCICGPFNNGENGCQVATRLFVSDGFNGITLKHKHTMEEIKPFFNAITESQFLENKSSFVVHCPWLPFHTIAMPRPVWDALGGTDERLEVRGNDLDFCRRAAMMGVRTLLELSAFCLHFGGNTIPKITSEADYNEANKHFSMKWNNT